MVGLAPTMPFHSEVYTGSLLTLPKFGCSCTRPGWASRHAKISHSPLPASNNDEPSSPVNICLTSHEQSIHLGQETGLLWYKRFLCHGWMHNPLLSLSLSLAWANLTIDGWNQPVFGSEPYPSQGHNITFAKGKSAIPPLLCTKRAVIYIQKVGRGMRYCMSKIVWNSYPPKPGPN